MDLLWPPPILKTDDGVEGSIDLDQPVRSGRAILFPPVTAIGEVKDPKHHLAP